MANKNSNYYLYNISISESDNGWEIINNLKFKQGQHAFNIVLGDISFLLLTKSLKKIPFFRSLRNKRGYDQVLLEGRSYHVCPPFSYPVCVFDFKRCPEDRIIIN